MRTLNSSLRGMTTCALTAMGLLSSSPALAQNFSVGNTSIGDQAFGYGTTYSGFWRANAPDYSVLTDGANTYFNAPSGTGTLFFRAANTGSIQGSEMYISGGAVYMPYLAVFDPLSRPPTTFNGEVMVQASQGHDGVWASTNVNDTNVSGIHGITATQSGNSWGVLGEATNTGTGVKGSAVSQFGSGVWGTNTAGHGVYGTTGSGYPYAGVYGTATPSSNGVGVLGNVDHGTGVEGTTITGNGAAGYANGAGVGVWAGTANSAGTGLLAYNPTATTGYALYANGKAGGTTNWAGQSDARLKRDIKDAPYGLEQVRKLRAVTFKWKNPERGDATHLGFIAQDVQKLVPEVVREDASEMLSIEYASMVPVLARAVQQQQEIIERKEARIATLERGRAPLLSYVIPGGLGGLALGLVPLGLVATRRRREEKDR